ncbi:sarcosine oxidase subunit gamma family protein [Frigidibacter sp. MR17.14]|uniref:sarcosine oxidase subunit gamma n=1 Tax=Frigidibacter sp. MR17.14 TaxID=3126509 RepID=UPI003012AC25
MANLYARSPAEGLVPLAIGTLTLDERLPGRITSVAPYEGQEAATEQALQALGLGWPAPGTGLAGAVAACLWTGRGQAFLTGIAPEGLAGLAALTDQSDAWTVLTLTGPDARAALARLTPLDLRPAAFPEGAAQRSLLGHMSAILRHCGPDSFEVWVFRSMAATAVHELSVVMRSLAARAALT